ncbi:M20 family metallopeptidase [Granulosicoccus sp. 3-233]|uniref:M20 family metallopeptidase n=1 Tax=Granulosicoccus sp. 3-233 TaxID=3417969 RepID=UPI003D328D7B
MEIVTSFCQELDASHEIVTVPEELYRSDEVSGPRINLLSRPAMALTDDLPEVLIYFHMDTAPEGHGWTRPAFGLTVEQNRVYGRGTADMKGAVVAVLDALRRLRQAGTVLKYRPVLAFCTDEEGGKYPGIRYLAETRELPPILLNLNGSADNRIWAGCFGSLTYELVFTGKTAHSGTPEMGVNAVEESLPAVLALMKLKEKVEQRESDMPARPWASEPLRARLTLTSIKAGDMGSAIPGECRIIINRRYLPEEEESQVHDELMSVLTAALAASRLSGWSMTQTGHLPPVKNPDGPGTERWTAARAAAAGIPMSDFTRYGSSTSSDFGWVQRAGIQHMLLGGLSRPERNVHGPDEHTTTDDLIYLSKSIENFLSASFHLPDTSSSSITDNNP